MLLLLNCISNCSSRMALKTWNMFRKFDKFCLFSPVREKWILKRKIRIWLLLQMFPGWRKMFGGGSILYGFMTAACLFVLFFSGIEWRSPWWFYWCSQKFFTQYCHFLELFIISDCTFSTYLLSVYTLCIPCINGIALSLHLY